MPAAGCSTHSGRSPKSALAAALAWSVAHGLLGHPQPFFAPIAAISLSTSAIQRSRRIAQMVVGVLLGIGVAEILHGPLGDSTAALGAIVLITMAIALAAGVSFFGDGMMFPNQAAASAILVVTLHRQRPRASTSGWRHGASNCGVRWTRRTGAPPSWTCSPTR